ncbi:MAG: HEPN domain-containing protein [Thermoplasmata archaeon]|nr:MAG: HEPN domain-containing protein [Thermoplasmata archaeon]
MRLKDCYEKGLLRKRRPDSLKSKRAIELAKSDLDRAARLMESEFYMESRLLSYTGMFQAARALLFIDGVFERSHACVVEYLRVNYTKKHILDINYVNWLDSLRVERHETLYGLDIIDVSKEEAEDALSKGLKFVEKVTEILS